MVLALFEVPNEHGEDVERAWHAYNSLLGLRQVKRKEKRWGRPQATISIDCT